MCQMEGHTYTRFLGGALQIQSPFTFLGLVSVHPHLVEQAVVDGRLYGVAQQDAVARIHVAVGHVELDAGIHVDPRAHHDEITLRHLHPLVALPRQPAVLLLNRVQGKG